MASKEMCEEYPGYFSANREECQELLEEDEESELSPYEKLLAGIPTDVNVKRVDPLTAVTSNKMFPFIALGAIGVAAYLLFFNKGKNKII